MKIPSLCLNGAYFSIHPLALLLMVLTLVLSGPVEAFTILASLFIHESAHLLAAVRLETRLHSIELMPFGAAIRLENPYSEPPGKLFLLSAAGPAANLAFAALFYVLGGTGIARACALVGAFNLLPALPLDGGRMLYCVLSPILGRRRAMQTGIIAGFILGALLAVTAFSGIYMIGRLNVTLAVAAVFLFAAAGREQEALNDARSHGLVDKTMPQKTPLPVRTYAVTADTPPHKALSLCSPGEANLFIVYDNGTPGATLDAGEVIRLSAASSARSMGELAHMACANAEKKV